MHGSSSSSSPPPPSRSSGLAVLLCKAVLLLQVLLHGARLVGGTNSTGFTTGLSAAANATTGASAPTTGSGTTTGPLCVPEPARDPSKGNLQAQATPLNVSFGAATNFSARICVVDEVGERVFKVIVPAGTKEFSVGVGFLHSDGNVDLYLDTCADASDNKLAASESYSDGEAVVEYNLKAGCYLVILNAYKEDPISATGVEISGFVELAPDTTTGVPASTVSDASSGELSSGAVAGIVVGSVGSLAVLVAAAFGAFVYFQRGRAKVSGDDGPSAAEQQFQSKQIQEQDLSFGKRLAEGNFGEVWLGEWKGSPCVIKKLKDSGDEARAELIVEARQLAKLRISPNICSFYGVCLDGELPCIVLELVPGGELKTLLYDHSNIVTERDIFEMASNLASGMELLHDQNVLHLDLACRNFLVTGQHPLSLRICDFGLSQSLPEGQETIPVPPGAQFPVRWSDPAIWCEGTFSKACDVFSFGVCLWEMTERSVPWPKLMTNASVREAIDAGETLPRPDPPRSSGVSSLSLDFFFNIMQECWVSNGATRSRGFKELRKSLGKHRERDLDLTHGAKGDQSDFYAARFERGGSSQTPGHDSERQYGEFYSNASPSTATRRAHDLMEEGSCSTAISSPADSPMMEGSYSTPMKAQGIYSTPVMEAEGSYSTPVMEAEGSYSKPGMEGSYSPAMARSTAMEKTYSNTVPLPLNNKNL